MRPRLITATVAALVVAASLAAPALAQPYPPPPFPEGDPTVVVQTPGAKIEVFGANWGPGTIVVITRDDGTVITRGDGSDGSSASGQTLGTATVADDGTFHFEAERPADAEPADTFRVKASGMDAQGAEVAVTAEAAPVRSLGDGTDEGGIPRGAVLAGALLVLAGGLVWRRRVTAGAE